MLVLFFCFFVFIIFGCKNVFVILDVVYSINFVGINNNIVLCICIFNNGGCILLVGFLFIIIILLLLGRSCC